VTTPVISAFSLEVFLLWSTFFFVARKQKDGDKYGTNVAFSPIP
jgi:hypothetical protein